MGWLDGRKSSDEEENSNADEKIIADLKAQVERLTAQNNVLSGQNNAYAYTSQDQREKIAKLQERLAKYESDGDENASGDRQIKRLHRMLRCFIDTCFFGDFRHRGREQKIKRVVSFHTNSLFI